MDYTPPTNIDNHDADIKIMAFFRNSRLILCSAVLTSILIIGGILTFILAKKVNTSQPNITIMGKNQPQTMLKQGDKVTDPIAINMDKPSAIPPPKSLIVTVRSKDNLGKIFKRFGLSTKTANNILALKRAKPLTDLHDGNKITIILDSTNTKIKELAYEVDALNSLIVTAVNNNWRINTKHIEPTSTLKYAGATIDGSIYSAGKNEGIPRKLITKFINIFSHKVNIKKICKGDHFALFYREYTVNGKEFGDQQLAAAELVNKGEMHRVIGFTDPHGYTDFYTPDGRSIKPAFVRYPLTNFKRISSRFSLARHHPILGITRPHYGVDFAARSGTPVKATSNGKIAFVGSRNGHGKTVIIKHGIYRTLYAHLSRYGKEIHSGKNIRQGDVIGYVGSTGLSTSSHLHYEFLVNGVHRDPLKVKLPASEMIEAKYRHKFFALSKKMSTELDLHNEYHGIYAMNYSRPYSKH